MAAATKPGKANPSDTVNMGFIGVAGRGSHLLDLFLAFDDVNVAAVCDVYEPHRQRAVEMTKGTATPYHDFRDVLARDDIDAVVVATPPHWHALITVMACEAGKDVYCEKPMCLSPVEGRAMINAARRNHRITQVGTQIHATENYTRVVELVRSGIVGEISCVRSQLNLNEAPGGNLGGLSQITAPPADLDWDLWLGPLEEMPFNPAMFKNGLHRYWAELVGSWLHEMGPHIMDLPMWALQPGHPKKVSAMGGKFATHDDSTIPDTLDVHFDYGDYIVTWSNMCANSHGLAYHRDQGLKRRLGTSFHGTDGTILADYGWHQVVSEADRMDESAMPAKTLPRSPGHGREFLNCIKSRELPSCDVESHYPLHVALNLGNLSYKLGRPIEWDAETETVVGDREANEMMQPNYRGSWKLPV
jgi:predicted dehydrogenase